MREAAVVTRTLTNSPKLFVQSDPLLSPDALASLMNNCTNLSQSRSIEASSSETLILESGIPFVSGEHNLVSKSTVIQKRQNLSAEINEIKSVINCANLTKSLPESTIESCPNSTLITTTVTSVNNTIISGITTRKIRFF